MKRLEERRQKEIDNKKKIIELINSISGRYSPYEVFCDFVKSSALAISNSCSIFHNELWQQREEDYIQTMSKYQLDEQRKLIEMFSLLVIELEENISDVLGSIYMMANLGNKGTGQFFTPYHLSQLMVQLSHFKSNDEIGKINEPSCGAGGSIIAMAEEMKKQGVDYQRYMDVVAQDIDWKCVYMCYVQLSLLGISAVVVQGDTLANPYIPGKTDPAHILYTPKRMGVLI